MKISDKRFEELRVNYSSLLPCLSKVHENFGGPSVYFHQQAIQESRNNFLSDRHIEMIYATLSAWGMHRMGKTKTKMVDFSLFKSALLNIKPNLDELRFVRLEEYTSEPTDILNKLKTICFQLRVSVSDSKVVGNSKALAHILPNLVPPVDRQYTVRFFAESLSNFRDGEEENFYNHILIRCYQFVKLIKSDSRIVLDDCFNTSFPKVFDNLIMASLKNLQVNREVISV